MAKFVWASIASIAVLTIPLYIIAEVAPIKDGKAVDMILIAAHPNDPGGNPFYIDIFEMRCDQDDDIEGYTEKGPCNFGKASNKKPAKYTEAEAFDVCDALGKRLPTVKEWVAAASNRGQNKTYTLRGDKITDARGRKLANFDNPKRDGESFNPVFYKKLGIDPAGTVGMTGNRQEWAMDQEGNYYRCGGDYEDAKHDIKLDNICEDFSTVDPDDSDRYATVRCVVDFDEANPLSIKYSRDADKREIKDVITRAFDEWFSGIGEFDQLDQARRGSKNCENCPKKPKWDKKMD